MDVNTKEQIRWALLKRQSEIGADLEKNLISERESTVHQAEIIDIAQALEQQDRDKTLAEQERRELVEIERALTKLSSVGFGVCEDCGEDIPPRRLMAVPSARLCAGCQSIEERLLSRLNRANGRAAAR